MLSLAPSPAAKKLARVEGSLELEFPARVDELRIEVKTDNPAATREIEGAVVDLRSFAPQSSWGAAAEFQIKFADLKEALNFRIGTADVEFVSPGDVKRSGWIGAASSTSAPAAPTSLASVSNICFAKGCSRRTRSMR